jgi:hypothetical protein
MHSGTRPQPRKGLFLWTGRSHRSTKSQELMGDTLGGQEGLAAYARAEHELRQAVELKPNTAGYWNDLNQLLSAHVATLCHQLGDAGERQAYEAALAAIDKAAALEPEQQEYRKTRDELHARLPTQTRR